VTLEQAKELMALAVDINGAECRKAEYGDAPCVFIRFYGHVASFDIDVHPHGWIEGGTCVRFEIDLEGRYGDDYEAVRNYLVDMRNGITAEKKCAGSGNSEMAHTE
ncbi:hypothetical protein LH384_32305, partial [Pseudomonas aeruginosa]|nr:hypothetical protein [Pseudomonas aeruginosa]